MNKQCILNISNFYIDFGSKIYCKRVNYIHTYFNDCEANKMKVN